MREYCLACFDANLRIIIKNVNALRRKKKLRTHRCRCILSLSGRRGSNSRPSAWKADALSTELLPHCSMVGSDGFEPPKSKDSRFTVCPIWPLWKLPIAVKALQSYDYFIVFATLRPKKVGFFTQKSLIAALGVTFEASHDAWCALCLLEELPHHGQFSHS